MNWGALIKETYGDIIRSIDSLNTHGAYCKAKLSKICGGDYYLKKNYGTITTSVAQWKANRFYYLVLEHISEYVQGYKLIRSDST